MFTRSDLSTLMAARPAVAVSIFLPTHVSGQEIRQDPIRLKNLTTQARKQLIDAGVSAAETEALLSPALDLVEDSDFWQHQDRGLALFLDGSGPRIHKVPQILVEDVVVGPGFHVKPLLPLLAADGAFLVLTLTADKVGLYAASRFDLAEEDPGALPRSLAEVAGDPDYENPVQASPVARPNTGTTNISRAQVYGDSPPEWRNTQLVEFAQKVASAADDLIKSRGRPLVLVADAKLAGHFQKASSLGGLLAGVVERNPESLDRDELHAVTYDVVRERLDASRHDAIERFTALRERDATRAPSSFDEVVRAAYRGQVETLLVRLEEPVRGHYDLAVDEVVRHEETATAGEDLVEAAAVQTLAHGGRVHVVSVDDIPDTPPAVAVLRY